MSENKENKAEIAGNFGDNIKWKLTGGTLIISGKGKMPFTNRYPWRSHAKDIVAVVIENGVNSIGSFAFEDCTGITSVTIPDTVTAIDMRAFSNLHGLTSIAIPDSVIVIGKSAFAGCSGLTSVEIPASVTKIEESAFRDCSGLTSVTIPDSVMAIEKDVFSYCSRLKSVTIPGSVVNIERFAFGRCSGLTSVNIPGSVVKIEESAFRNTGLTSIIIPDSVTEIEEHAFCECNGLTSVTIPKSVNKIDSYAFSNCENLTSVTVCGADTEFNENAFYNCPAHFTVHPDHPKYASIDGKLTVKTEHHIEAILTAIKEATVKIEADGWIYFYKNIEDHGLGLFKARPDGTGFMLIFKPTGLMSDFRNMQIKDDWIYFDVTDGYSKHPDDNPYIFDRYHGTMSYKVTTNGENLTLVSDRTVYVNSSD